MRKFTTVLIALILSSGVAIADQPVSGANADPTYKQLRAISLGGEIISVKDFTLRRDAGTFKFRQGTFMFLTPVNGKVTGAVFSGEGEFILSPPVATESRTLSLLTKQDGNEFVEKFRTVVLRFTDNTFEEIKKGGAPAQAITTAVSDDFQSFQDYARKTIRYNYDARLLQDVLSTAPGGFFIAFIHGDKYSNKLLYTIDPHGADDVAPEEVSLRTFDDGKYGIWAAFHFSDEYKNNTVTGTQENTAFDVERQKLDTTIEKNGYLRGDALTTIVSNSDALRSVDFNLFPKLRVQKVTDSDGNPLDFIQEDQKKDYNFWVVLPKPLAKGEKFTIHTLYNGEDAVLDMGRGNYYPVARSNWYPNPRFGRYTMYEMRFSVPKDVQTVATGDLVSQTVEGEHAISNWKTAVPEPVAGFNLGDFKKLDATVERGGYTVESFANQNQPDIVAALAQYHISALGAMDTRSLMKKPLAEAQLAVDLYNFYYGPLPYKRVSMTQQTACNYGQSWPSLVYLPICSYFDAAVRHQLGLQDYRGYWTIVAPHEIAHQWWGHTVGFNSYRDQWMSEGFSDFSAALFLQMALKDNKANQKFWKDEYDLLTEKNNTGHRGIDTGPLVLGYRLNTTKSGDIYRRLIYPKGAYVLHMIHMMMTDQLGRDDRFRQFMQDFVRTYKSRAASTEDFKAVLEKHMSTDMDLEQNHKMDWFFNEYVYGTALPSYKFDYSLAKGEGSAIMLKVKITQSNVDENFRMAIPIYLELADGRMIKLGTVPIVGNSTFEHTIPINGLEKMPKRALVNYNYDVLGAF